MTHDLPAMVLAQRAAWKDTRVTFDPQRGQARIGLSPP